MKRAPHWGHQRTCGNAHAKLRNWSLETGLGESVQAPGLIFSDADNVIPDVVWTSKNRLSMGLDESGRLTIAPELIIEVLSFDVENERRDREMKLKLYAERGVQDYLILNWQVQQVEMYRRQTIMLKLVETLFSSDPLTSPLLPNFSCSIDRLFL